ncbi:MAG: hypothetical protein KKD48_00580 [Nanoarchaeota archaeon]|nr:hypothetical protein [Nanoarchaeota archaeon]
MNIESHLKNLKESLEEIENSIKIGIERRQRTIGFHTSVAGCDMLEILLHKLNLIDSGFAVKHDWFNSKRKIAEKINIDFPKKNDILDIMYEIETNRNLLCYGKIRDKEIANKVIFLFNKLKKIFMEAGLDEIEKFY